MAQVHLNKPSIKRNLFNLSTKLGRIAVRSYKVTKDIVLYILCPVMEYKRKKKKKKAVRLDANEKRVDSFIEDGRKYSDKQSSLSAPNLEIRRLMIESEPRESEADEERRVRRARRAIRRARWELRHEVGESSRSAQLPRTSRRHRANGGPYRKTEVPLSKSLGAGRFWDEDGAPKRQVRKRLQKSRK